MKGNTTKYLLSIAVIVIWGVIGYKLYTIFAGDGQVGQSNIESRGRAVHSATPDTFSLKSNGIDPFFRQISLSHLSGGLSSAKRKEPSKPKVVASQYIWPSVQYLGVVSQSGGQKQSVIISINGISHILQKGDVARGLELINVMVDSVKLKYFSETKYFVRSGIK